MKRKEMEAVIAGGGSVLHQGRLITSVDKLPSVAQLALSEEEKAAAADDLDAKIAEMQKQRAALNSGKSSAPKSNTEEKTEDGLPEDFPMKHVFEKLGLKTAADIQAKTREELIALEGIGEATADKALAYGK